MIEHIEDILKEIPKFNDTKELVDSIRFRLGTSQPNNEWENSFFSDVAELCNNAEAMQKLLRSARHHLATKMVE